MYVGWANFSLGIVFYDTGCIPAPQAITARNAFVHKICTLQMHPFHRYEGGVKSSKWWPWSPDLLNPKSTGFDKVSRTSHSDHGFSFYRTNTHTHTHTHTCIHSHTSKQSDRCIRGAVLRRRLG